MKFCSLGSGSSGNSYLVSEKNTNILVDCGFSVTELESRMFQREIKPSEITAIFLTHEHDDHSKGAFAFAEKHNKPIYLTYGTLKMCHKRIKKSYNLRLNIISPLDTLELNDFMIYIIPVPHDAREPVQFKFESEKSNLAIITDLGFGNKELINSIQQINALILESNHDENLLNQSSYPKNLKDRIRSKYGHLSNEESLAILKKLNLDHLKWLGAAHLSKENNSPQLVKDSWKKVFEDKINIIDPDFGIPWVNMHS
jgi:phosphoribosyl 1,2-cyclic phosphodiesterase